MIDAKELRIGNWVLVDDEINRLKLKNIPFYVTGIYEISGFFVSLENKHYKHISQYSKYLSPIPLTENILLKCGFDKKVQGIDEITTYYTREDFTITLSPMELEYYTNSNIVNLGDKSPKYVHELQNLYFALTKEELEIEL